MGEIRTGVGSGEALPLPAEEGLGKPRVSQKFYLTASATL